MMPSKESMAYVPVGSFGSRKNLSGSQSRREQTVPQRMYQRECSSKVRHETNSFRFAVDDSSRTGRFVSSAQSTRLLAQTPKSSSQQGTSHSVPCCARRSRIRDVKQSAQCVPLTHHSATGHPEPTRPFDGPRDVFKTNDCTHKLIDITIYSSVVWRSQRRHPTSEHPLIVGPVVGGERRDGSLLGAANLVKFQFPIVFLVDS
jgi:hypothetical protein